jgi:Tol biopolymer transport system component
MNADGSGEVNLSSSEADDREPVWSPDGRRVAFVSDRDGNQEIYLVDVDGSGLRNLTNSPANEDHPRFFPDGRVAFTSFDEGAIFVVNADGSGRERLPTVTGGPPLSFAISPAGDRFAAQAPAFNGMVIADLDGTVLAFTDLLPPLGGDQTGGTPMFSPDGRSIIYSSEEIDLEPSNANVQRLSIDGPTWERLTDEPTDELDPVFSPDGRRIAFSRGTAGDPASFEVFVMDADGANPTRLTAGRVADWR